MTQTATKSQFAKLIGCAPSYVTALSQAGRLVMTDDGKHVDVEASKKRIEETADPNRADVKERHARERDTAPRASKPSESFNFYRTRKMQADAEMAELQRDQLLGKLVEVNTIEAAGAEVGTAIRTKLENMEDQLAIELNLDERQRATLNETIERILTELAQQLGNLGNGKAGDVT